MKIPTRASSQAGQLPLFNTFRGLAVLLVLVDHFGAHLPPIPVLGEMRPGVVGVRCFLVLSGYFITLSLLRARAAAASGRQTVPQAMAVFYIRRFSRIVPAYVLCVAACALLGLGTVREQLPWLATFTLNFHIAARNEWPDAVSHLWSICVQEQFYLVWPAVVLVLPSRLLNRVLLGVACVAPLFRAVCIASETPLIARWVLPFACLDSLAIGALLAANQERLLASIRAMRRWRRWAAGVAAAGLIVVAGVWRRGDPNLYGSVFVETVESLALAWFVANLAAVCRGRPAGGLLVHPALVALGRVSYGLYIYHVLVAMLFDLWTPAPFRGLLEQAAPRFLLLASASVACAFASWHLFEAPLMDFFKGSVAARVASMRPARGGRVPVAFGPPVLRPVTEPVSVRGRERADPPESAGV